MGYIDPGLFGTLSQVGMTVFLLLVTGFAFFLKPIKRLLGRLFHKEVQTKSDSLIEIGKNQRINDK
jgi:hypothetical protein